MEREAPLSEVRGVRQRRVAPAVAWFVLGFVGGFGLCSAWVADLERDLQEASWQLRGLLPKTRNERRAIAALKTIATVESIFREGDKDGNGALDYASLAQLGQTQLIDAVLASGTKDGYVFQVSASVSTSEFLWFAVVSPLKPGVTGDRYFEMNHSAVIFFTTAASFALNTTDCNMTSPWPRGG
jgi:hypothetical protein